jgi:hypothetical protein
MSLKKQIDEIFDTSNFLVEAHSDIIKTFAKTQKVVHIGSSKPFNIYYMGEELKGKGFTNLKGIDSTLSTKLKKMLRLYKQVATKLKKTVKVPTLDVVFDPAFDITLNEKGEYVPEERGGPKIRISYALFDRSDETIKGNLFHEVGHYLWDIKLEDKHKKAVERMHNYLNKYKVEDLINEGWIPNAYAMKNKYEFFCELFAMEMLKPGVLIEESSSLIKQIVKDIK